MLATSFYYKVSRKKYIPLLALSSLFRACCPLWCHPPEYIPLQYHRSKQDHIPYTTLTLYFFSINFSMHLYILFFLNTYQLWSVMHNYFSKCYSNFLLTFFSLVWHSFPSFLWFHCSHQHLAFLKKWFSLGAVKKYTKRAPMKSSNVSKLFRKKCTLGKTGKNHHQ